METTYFASLRLDSVCNAFGILVKEKKSKA